MTAPTIEAVLDDAVAAADTATREALATSDDALAEAILELAALPRLDYERVRRARAQAFGMRASALDAAVHAARQASGEEQSRQTQRDVLVGIGAEGELWQDDTGTVFASIEVAGHVENYAVRSEAYRRWLQREYGDRNPVSLPDGSTRPGAPGGQALADAINQLVAMGSRGPAEPWFVRVGWDDGTVYLDLGGPLWDAVEIDELGVRIVARPRVRFVRPGGLKPLPTPQSALGGIDRLRELLGLDDDASKLAIGWLVGCFMPEGPYPILVLSGEQGSGKTTLTRMCRRLVDPNAAETRTKPREERDLLLAARNGRVVALENLSKLDQDLSDAMCRVATGGSFSTRTLYTDLDETLISVCRPQVVNAIPEIATAGDLVDRAVMIELPARDGAGTEFEADLWRRFDAAAPVILGALLEAVSVALRRLPVVTLSERPRMADFARWVEAAAPALGWGEGEFLAAYLENRRRGALIPLEADTLAKLVMHLVEAEPRWAGEPTALLERLKALATDEERRDRAFPKTAHHLSSRLKRLGPALRRVGITMTHDRTRSSRFIEIEAGPKTASSASPASRANDINGLRVTLPKASASPQRHTGGEQRHINGMGRPEGGHHDAGDADDASRRASSWRSPETCCEVPEGEL